MFYFSSSEVPPSVSEEVQHLNMLPQQSVRHIVENILKYLTGEGGINKEALSEQVANFASMADIDLGKAQALAKILLNILKASFRGNLSSSQVQHDFEKLTSSAETTRAIVELWSTYVRPPSTAPAEPAAAEPTAPAVSAPAAAASQPADPTLLTPDAALPLEEPPPPLAPGLRLGDELLDVDWTFGVTAASSDPARCGATFVRLGLHVRSAAGQTRLRKVQLTVGQFYSLLHQLEKARALARLM